MQKFAVLLLIVALLSACAAPGGSPSTGAPAPAVEAPAAEATTAPAAEADATEEPAADLPLVRVCHVPVTIYAPLFIAAEKGYFAEEGMHVELLPVEGGTENVVQVSAGNFEVAGGGIGAGMLNAVARGIGIGRHAEGRDDAAQPEMMHQPRRPAQRLRRSRDEPRRKQKQAEPQCRRELDPPRFCPTCGRRLRVQVAPTGVTATCRDHGPVDPPA